MFTLCFNQGFSNLILKRKRKTCSISRICILFSLVFFFYFLFFSPLFPSYRPCSSISQITVSNVSSLLFLSCSISSAVFTYTMSIGSRSTQDPAASHKFSVLLNFFFSASCPHQLIFKKISPTIKSIKMGDYNNIITVYSHLYRPVWSSIVPRHRPDYCKAEC